MPSSASASGASAALQLEILVGRGERPAGDEAEAGLCHARALGVDEAQLPDRRVHDLVVHHLLDALQRRLAPLAVELAGLLTKEPVDVGIAAVDVRPARHHEVL